MLQQSMMVRSFFSKPCLVLAVLSVMLLPLSAEAGIRVFDENQGSDVDAKQQGGKLEALPTLKIEQAPRRDVVAPVVPDITDAQKEKAAKQEIRNKLLQAKSPSDIVLGPFEEEIYTVGHAQIFIDTDAYTDELAKSLHVISEIEGLKVDTYIKDMEKFSQLVAFTKGSMLHSPTEVQFRRDSKNKRFKELHMRNYNSIHYTSPFGDVREFPLDNPQFILNKVNYVRQQLRERQ